MMYLIEWAAEASGHHTLIADNSGEAICNVAGIQSGYH
jgi:hypothetical protein